MIVVLQMCFLFIIGQTTQNPQATTKKEFRHLDVFPAISYSPETKLTLGAIGIKYFDFDKDHFSTPISNLEFIGVYTLNKQIIAEAKWEFFFGQNLWRSRGEAFFNRYPDRNYGLGNNAAALLVEVKGESKADTLNYLNFDSDRIKFSPVILRKIKRNLYVGIQYDMEYLYRMQVTAGNYHFLNADSLAIIDMPVAGLRSGLGLQALFDNRSPILNPLNGGMAELNIVTYHKYLGSDFSFTSLSTDLRYFKKTFTNHTIALRIFGSAQLTNDVVPMRALSRVGGHKLVRGYFKGTYQDYHMTGFEMEYRWPFWREGNESKLWQVWKRLGMVTFLSGAQVFHTLQDFQINRFNLAVGSGLRILFNPESRVNIRIDYAVGLQKGSDGPGKRQHGFYFYLGEAF
jgi:hypothetical protein